MVYSSLMTTRCQAFSREYGLSSGRWFDVGLIGWLGDRMEVEEGWSTERSGEGDRNRLLSEIRLFRSETALRLSARVQSMRERGRAAEAAGSLTNSRNSNSSSF